MSRAPSAAYVAPFCSFLVLLALSRVLPLPPFAVQVGFLAIMLAILAALVWPLVRSGSDVDLRVRHLALALLLGIAVFVIWILPDRLFPGYHHFWLFENSVTGKLETTLSAAARAQTAVLWLRAFRAVIIVPIIEELFWRAWLMRWLIDPDFTAIPLGAWSARAFWIVAIMFAAEHGPYWDVGLITGVIYNWWMIRTRSLGDLVLVHAVTNACLSAYVIWSGRWEYWL